ncbi:hypothetical protein [Actinomadura livida]|uniref:Uncharacterized protein n=1 Tax=Actinomadura livida TaxID=79909 RepID=A0A7W7IET0_9ACTN|nr:MULTISPECIES: hypothetical protein [Actinomadura]MBB4775675.1 hypothetical protein [Actinomadura catellatispora]GGU34325.1 hypothetical protein GCM10010208_68630 [Actinomadura livida]
MAGTTPRRRYGPAGLLVILLVVGGLVFSYGLGHAPVSRVCTEQAVSAPLKDHSSLKQGQPDVPLNACLCLAVLFTLLLLGLAAGSGRPAFRLPARAGWAVVLRPEGRRVPVPRHSLQVLRL